MPPWSYNAMYTGTAIPWALPLELHHQPSEDGHMLYTHRSHRTTYILVRPGQYVHTHKCSLHLPGLLGRNFSICSLVPSLPRPSFFFAAKEAEAGMTALARGRGGGGGDDCMGTRLSSLLTKVETRYRKTKLHGVGGGGGGRQIGLTF